MKHLHVHAHVDVDVYVHVDGEVVLVLLLLMLLLMLLHLRMPLLSHSLLLLPICKLIGGHGRSITYSRTVLHRLRSLLPLWRLLYTVRRTVRSNRR